MNQSKIFFDTNVLVYAHDRSSTYHAESALLLASYSLLLTPYSLLFTLLQPHRKVKCEIAYHLSQRHNAIAIPTTPN